MYSFYGTISRRENRFCDDSTFLVHCEITIQNDMFSEKGDTMPYDLSNEFAAKLAVMLEASLLYYKHYELWCDDIIENMQNPPDWILSLTTTKYLPDARNIVYRYAFSSSIPDFCYTDFYLACLYVKYKKKQISWGTFLFSAGQYSDGNSCFAECEYFYGMLTELEEHEFSVKVETKQSNQVSPMIAQYIAEVERLYAYFMIYFRRYCNAKNNR